MNLSPSVLGGLPAVIFQNFTVSGTSTSTSRRRSEPMWTWMWNNWTRLAVPVTTRDAPNITLTAAYNTTLCSVLADNGLLHSGLITSEDASRVSGLLNFSWSDDYSAVSFASPCRPIDRPPSSENRGDVSRLDVTISFVLPDDPRRASAIRAEVPTSSS